MDPNPKSQLSLLSSPVLPSSEPGELEAGFACLLSSCETPLGTCPSLSPLLNAASVCASRPCPQPHCLCFPALACHYFCHRCCGRWGKRKQGGNQRPRAGSGCKYLTVRFSSGTPWGSPVGKSILGSRRCCASPGSGAQVGQVTLASSPGAAGHLVCVLTWL